MKLLRGKTKSTTSDAHSHVSQTDITHKLAIKWQEAQMQWHKNENFRTFAVQVRY